MRTSQEKQRQRTAPAPARRTRPVHYRLTKSEAEIAAEAGERRSQPPASASDEEDYSPFLYSMLGTAMFVFLVQTISSLIIANYFGASIGIELWFGLMPYIQLTVSPSSFISISTWASVATVLVATLRSMFALAFLRKSRQVLDGRAMGLVMGGLLLVYQYIRHLLNPPLIDTWVYAQTMAGVVAATVIYLGFRPTGHQSAHAERAARPTRVGRSTNPTQATEQ